MSASSVLSPPCCVCACHSLKSSSLTDSSGVTFSSSKQTIEEEQQQIQGNPSRVYSKPPMRSIGVQTARDIGSINPTLPLWAMALSPHTKRTGKEEAIVGQPNYPFSSVTDEGVAFAEKYSAATSFSFEMVANLFDTPVAVAEPSKPTSTSTSTTTSTSALAEEMGSKLASFKITEETIPVANSSERLHTIDAYQSITVMPEYETSSFEELRVTDVTLYPDEACRSPNTTSQNFSTFYPPSTAPFTLYRDVIQTILKYLDVNNLVTAVQLSSQWYQAVDKSPSLGITTKTHSGKLLRMPYKSVIARHIESAPNVSDAIDESWNWVFQGYSMFSHLADLLPSLKTFNFRLSKSVPVYSLPPQLRSIRIVINEPCAALISSIGQLQHLRDLHLDVSERLKHQFDYSPLTPVASQLESLHFKFNYTASDILNSVSFSSLRKFVRQSRLSHFSFTTYSFEPSSACLLRLLEPTEEEPTFPFMDSGNLTSIDLSHTTLDGKLLRVLTKYPALTRIDPMAVVLHSLEMPLLAQLPNVTEIKFNRPPRTDTIPTTGDYIQSICEYLPNLRILHMDGSQVTNQQLHDCLSRLPHLTDLMLLGSSETSSLAPLLKHGLVERLTTLHLSDLSIGLDELSKILELKNLERLTLADVCFEQVPETFISQLRAMPKLTACSLTCLDEKFKAPATASGFKFNKPTRAPLFSSAAREPVATARSHEPNPSDNAFIQTQPAFPNSFAGFGSPPPATGFTFGSAIPPAASGFVFGSANPAPTASSEFGPFPADPVTSFAFGSAPSRAPAFEFGSPPSFVPGPVEGFQLGSQAPVVRSSLDSPAAGAGSSSSAAVFETSTISEASQSAPRSQNDAQKRDSSHDN